MADGVAGDVSAGDVLADDVSAGDGSAGGVLVGLRAAVDALVALSSGDRSALGDGASVVALSRELARLDAVACGQAAAFDASGEWAADGAHNSVSWVTARTRCPRCDARRRLRLGRAVASMGAIRALWLTGEVTGAHVEVLAAARVAGTEDLFARDEALLAGHAASLPFRHFERLVAHWGALAAPDDAEARAEARRARRGVWLSASLGGMWYANATLDPLSGEIVHDELTRLEQMLFDADWADAKARLGRTPLVGELARTATQRRADALVEMATRSAAAPAGQRRPGPLFTVLVGYETFAGRVCELASGTAITPGALAAWLDRAVIERVVFDGPSRVLDVGHRRLFTGALRRAIQVRDRGCTHPLCDRPAQRCDIDHIIPAADGGPTTQTNGRLLCGYHNRLRNHTPHQPEQPHPP
jgi:hypothetical protein